MKNKLFIFMILSLMLLSVSAVCAEDSSSLNLNETNTATPNSVSCQNNEVELVEDTLSKNDIDFNNLNMSNANEITEEPNTGDTIYVDPINGNDNNTGVNWNNSVKTINMALTLVNDNGFIYLGEGEHTTPATINKNVTLIGQNQEKTILTNNTSDYFLIIESSNTAFRVYNCTFRNNKYPISNPSDEGYGNKYYIDNCSFINNGRMYIWNANLTVNNSVFINNSAVGSGGAINMYGGNSIINNSVFINNSATDYGGAIYVNKGNHVINNSVFINNTAKSYNGGAIYVYGNSIITNSIFANNTANYYGGAIYTYTGTINNSVLLNNSVTDKGKAVYISNGNTSNVEGNWWGSNAPDWDSVISGTSAPKSFVVLDVSFNEISYNTYNVIANLYLNGTQTIANIPTRNVEFKCGSEVITDKMINGTYNKTYILDYGDDKEITVTVDNEIQNITLIGKEKIITNIILNDIVMIYQDGTRLIAVLTDIEGNPIANATIYFTINGVTYNRTTDNNGNASIALNLNPGEYNASVLFNGTDIYDSSSKDITVTIKSTIDAYDIVKFYQNGTQFFATFIDGAGNVLANTNVTFNINGVFYTRETNENGTARLTINLRPGEYILTAINPNSTEQKGFNITVKSLIEANDLTKYFQNASRFEAKIYNKDGSLAVNKSVTFNINGVFYTRTTNNDGVVSLAINLRPGNYTITTMYDGLDVGNAVNVLPTLLTNDLEMVYHDGSNFTAKALDGQGNPLANQNITFNVNGVFYHKVTDNDGIASLNINLNPGEYIITSIWNNYQVGNKITII